MNRNEKIKPEDFKFDKVRINDFIPLTEITDIRDGYIYAAIKNKVGFINRNLEFEDNRILIALLRIGMFVEKRILDFSDVDVFYLLEFDKRNMSKDSLYKNSIDKIFNHDLYPRLQNYIIDFIIRFGWTPEKKSGAFIYHDNQIRLDIENFIFDCLMITRDYYSYYDPYYEYVLLSEAKQRAIDVRQGMTQAEVKIQLDIFEQKNRKGETQKISRLVYVFSDVFEFSKYQILLSFLSARGIHDPIKKIGFCQFCGVPFDNKSGKQKFCTPEHSRQYNNNLDKKGNEIKSIPYDSKNVPEIRICERDGCNNIVNAERATKIYCSESCQRKAKREEKKQEESKKDKENKSWQ